MKTFSALRFLQFCLVVAFLLVNSNLSLGAFAPVMNSGDRTWTVGPINFVLSQNGVPVQPIIISPSASPAMIATANYLAEKLSLMSGGTFVVQQGNGNSGIVVGTISQFPDASLNQVLQIRHDVNGSGYVPYSKLGNGVESYAIRTEANRLRIIGATDLGTANGVSFFLYLSGYRRFFPAPEWEVAPPRPTFYFNWNGSDRPEILSRTVSFSYGYPAWPYIPQTAGWTAVQREGPSKKDIGEWARQNRLGIGTGAGGGTSFHIQNLHYWPAIYNENLAAYQADEYMRALVNGTRVAVLCPSYPPSRDTATNFAVERFIDYPAWDMVSMEPNDGNLVCQCPLYCQPVGGYSNRVFSLANHVALGVRLIHPNKMVGVLAYNQHDIPPTHSLEPNIHVQAARFFSTSFIPWNDRVLSWASKTKNFGIYDYFSTYQWGQDRLRRQFSAGPTADIKTMENDIKMYSAYGALSLTTESSIAWGAHGRGNYLASLQLWAPYASTPFTNHLNDFYQKAFGPAANAMKRYFERVDGENELLTKHLLAMAFRDVDEASDLAGSDVKIQARIDQIKQFLYYNYVQFRLLEESTTIEQKKPWMLESLRHQFRTRFTYMTHWAAQRTQIPSIAVTYGEPTWVEPTAATVNAAVQNGTQLTLPPWMDLNPYTSQETEEKFQAGLEYFQPEDVLPRATYSKDLVAVVFSGTSAVTQQVFYQEKNIYLYCEAGEPLQISLKPNLASEYVSTMKYKVKRSSTGLIVSSGSVPRDNAWHDLTFNVTTPGLYEITVTDPHWWYAKVPPGRINTIVAPTNEELYSQSSMNGGAWPSYFYVPKGVAQFQYMFDGLAHEVKNPDGVVALSVSAGKKHVTIAVPPGMDGKVWSFTGRFGQRKFINIPNNIAPLPSALAVPREVAIADNLTLR